MIEAATQLAFSPSAQFTEERLSSSAGVGFPEVFQIPVIKDLRQRRVYVMFSVSAGSFRWKGTLDFVLNGSVISSLPYFPTNLGDNGACAFGYIASGAGPYSSNQLRVVMNATQYNVPPVNVISTCDTIRLKGANIQTASGVSNIYLACYSEHYF